MGSLIIRREICRNSLASANPRASISVHSSSALLHPLLQFQFQSILFSLSSDSSTLFFNYITSASTLQFYISCLLSPPSSTPPFLSTTGWPEDPHRNARTFPTTPLDLPTLSLSSTVLLLRPRLLPNLIWSHHPPWWAARTLCAAALRQTSRCQLHTPPPPTALARPRRASVYMPASIPVATRYALVDPIMRASKADPQFAI